MTLPASPTAPKPSRRVLTVLVLATLLAPLLVWATASRTSIGCYHLLLDLLAFAVPCLLVGAGWANAWEILRWLITTSLGPCLLLLPSLGAWLGQRWRARRHAPSPA